MDLFHQFWERFQLACIGLVGALLALPVQRTHRTKKGFLIFALTGPVCAQLFTGLACRKLGVMPDDAYGIGCLIGMFGGSLIATGIRIIESIQYADVKAIVQGIFQPWTGGKK